jgi:hypothetical protein
MLFLCFYPLIWGCKDNYISENQKIFCHENRSGMSNGELTLKNSCILNLCTFFVYLMASNRLRPVFTTKSIFMKTQIYMLLLACFALPFSLLAQNCVNFESLAPTAQFGNGINSQGEVIFFEDEIPVTIEYFEWSSGGGTFGTATVIDGMMSFGSPQAMWTNNVNLGFNFFNVGFLPNRISFDFTDSGGEENISINGMPIYAGELMSAPMPGGITITFVDIGPHWRATLSGSISSLLIGGQEFAIDNVCVAYVEDPTDCVDFELLVLGSQYGNGINAQGDVIFTENDIPVSVEYFYWPGGGGTFGNSSVIDWSAINSGHAMWTNNINLGFDFNGLEALPNWVSFEFTDLGGNENIGINGNTIYAGELATAVVPAGFSLLITDMGDYKRAEVVSQNDVITELVVGGQEFAIDNICPNQVGFLTSCVDFESLSLGSMYGSGINSPGDVIFYENNIAVQVDSFFYVGGGGTFGFAEVMNTSGIGSGHAMREGNINLTFDFTEIGMFSEMVTFDFADFGGHENIAINGSAVYTGELSSASIPGFSINVSMSGDVGQCVIMGNIETLMVGGQEFFIDNVCAYQMVGLDEHAGDAKREIVTLKQNYPNPLNGHTIIPFELKEPSHVIIIVYDHLGRIVERLADKNYDQGKFNVSWNATDQSAGVYFYQLRCGKSVLTKKMSLIK